VEPSFESATGLAAAIRSKQLSPVEVAEHAIAVRERLNPHYNAFSFIDDESFLADARRAEAAVMAGEALPAFHGVPITVKDAHAVEGWPNSKCSLAMSDDPMPEDDYYITRTREAGFLLFGRTTTPELSTSSGCETPRYGITRNPWDTSLTSGGSTGGGSVAVAAGIAPVSTATDGGGSVRMPASCNGLVGLKPTRGLLAHQGPNYEASSVDSYMVRGIEDIATILDSVAHPDPLAWIVSANPETPAYREATRTPPARHRIALMTTSVNGAPVHPEVLDATLAIASFLEGLGHEIVPVEPTDVIDYRALELWNTVFSPGGSKVNPLVDRSRLQPYLQRRQEASDSLTVQEYLRGTMEMKRCTRRMVAHWLEDFELLLSPTMANRVPAAGVISEELNAGTADAADSATAGMSAFCPYVNVGGLAAISLPTHMDSRGVPIGTQLVGAPFSERTLLSFGAVLESEYSWLDRTPPIPE
jgi:amidase